MKNKLFLVMCFLSTFFISCNESEVIESQEVTFNVDYTFLESGDMSRAVNGEEVYTKFYNNYIKTKVLTPKNYTLTFKHKDNGASVTVNGLWNNKDGIRLVEGDYIVTGTSHPLDCPSDTVFLKFDETVKITKDMESLKLTAKYDSYLLMFDTKNVSEIYQTCSYSSANCKHNLRKNNIFCIFDNKAYCVNHNGGFYDYIKIKRNDNKLITINLSNFPFEKGKYYYFNDMTNSFDIPPMESGN